VRVSSASLSPDVSITAQHSSLDHVTDCTRSPRGMNTVRNSTMLAPWTWRMRTLPAPTAETAMREVVGADARIGGPSGAGAHAARTHAAASAANGLRACGEHVKRGIMSGTVPDSFIRLDVHFVDPFRDCHGRSAGPLMLNLQLRPGTRDPLVEQLVTGVRQHIESRLLRPGARLPSIRALATQQRVSRFTVVEAYDRLVASGHVESRRGSGFYVTTPAVPETAAARTGGLDRALDVANLIAEVVSEDARVAFDARKLYAGGCLPNDWQEESGIRRHARQVAARGIELTDFGTAPGYPPLRDFVARRLAELGIEAASSQVLLTAGATQGFDLLIRYLLTPGDAVLVDDPGYYNLFGHLKLAGARLLSVPRGPEGPDLDVLARLAIEHRPKAYFTMSVLNNPTCTPIQPAVAHRVLQLAAQHRFYVVEDDIFCDFADGAPPRLAALDRLERTFYLGSYSKTLSSSLRVGFVVAHADAIEALGRMKLLVTMTTSPFAERVVHEMLVGGHFRKHVARIRDRLDARRSRMAHELERAGWKLDRMPDAGLFLWARHPAVDDSLWIAQGARREGVRLAPGASFRPHHDPSPWMRFNASCIVDPAAFRVLARAPALARAARKSGSAM
jgi:DNA-binding transcriptional MocR family regulator